MCETGTQGVKYRDVGDVGMFVIIAKVGGTCDMSFFAKMCYLWFYIRFHRPEPQWPPYDVYTKSFLI